jgi:hypothetical protein
MKRKSISKSIRFEVFKRDSFTCHYCGEKAPKVILVIDHIKPVSKGGTNDILNLITACQDCNSGKSNKELSDNTVVQKQWNQLNELQVRKEQLDMMFKWQKGLLELDDHKLSLLIDFWYELTKGFSLHKTEQLELKKLIKKYTSEEIISAMKISSNKYFEIIDGEYSTGSIMDGWEKIPGICYNEQLKIKNPDLHKTKHIVNKMKRYYDYVDNTKAMQLLNKANNLGCTLEKLDEYSMAKNSWKDWKDGLEKYISENILKDKEIIQDDEKK